MGEGICLGLLFGFLLGGGCSPHPSSVKGTVEFSLVKKGSKAGKKAKMTQGRPTFWVADGAKVRAKIKLWGLEPGFRESHHVVWLKPGGKKLFQKIFEFEPDDSSSVMRSSFSITPARQRTPGIYTVKVYRYRRLLTSAEFELRERPQITGRIEFERVGGRKGPQAPGGEATAIPPVFTPAKGAKIQANILLSGCEPGVEECLLLRWIGPDSAKVFEKTVDLIPEEYSPSLESRMSISPKRQRLPGTYTVEVYRAEQLLTSGTFQIAEK